jgi:DNA repair photolyase
MKQIISASRRTDLPAFYLDWLIEHLNQGSVSVTNPMYPANVSEVSLRPKDVYCLALWSKDFGKFLQHVDEFKDYAMYFIFTINDNTVWEPHLPPLEHRLLQLEELADIYGPQCIEYRFDPIVFWRKDGAIMNNLEYFEFVLDWVSNAGVDNCTISFATWYPKVIERAIKHRLVHYDPSNGEKIAITRNLAAYGKKVGVKLYSCCNAILTAIPNVYKSHCIDGAKLQQLFGSSCSVAKHPTRSQCGCTFSRDIGNYNEQLCQHGCIYCYANPQI